MFFGLILTGVLALCAPCRADASPVVTIVIDPGHGGRSEEADETNSGCKYHGLEEKNVNLVTALAMYDELNEYGNVDVYLTRDVDGELSLARRVEFADEVNADVLISVHYNASADHNFFGSEIFTSAYGQCYAVGHALGEKIMDEWVKEGNTRKDIKTRIGKKGDYYGLIRNGTTLGIPTIILEHGYLDNDRDYLRIGNEAAWKRFGIMDATGVAKFYGLEKGVVKESVGPEEELVIPEDPVMPDDTEPEKVRLQIDNYNSNKGNIEFTLYAYDDERPIMYYGFMEGDDVDKDTVFPELELWDGRNGKLSGTYHIQPGYKGKLTAKVYNVYQLDGISNSVDLIPDEEAPDDAEDNAVIDDGVADEEDTMFLDEVKEEAAEDWVIGGNLPAIDTSAVANAIDKNTRSTVKDSYTGLLIAVLIGLVTVTVGTVLAIMSSAEKRRKKRRREGGGGRDVFDWAEDYDKD
ncbi:MAG: N-acetylmuramoyl-L-alanine amidase [Lachnospiraceae bacterium]|nr:N-acetylmuramoyl-L-alanine amidase [Lachnospiraceae bacterium]